MLNFGGVQKSLGLRACGTSKRSPWVFRVNFLDPWFFSGQRKNPREKQRASKRGPARNSQDFSEKSGVLWKGPVKVARNSQKNLAYRKGTPKCYEFIGDAWYITTLRVVEWNRKPIPLRSTQPLTTSKNANMSPPQPTPVPKKHQKSSYGVHTIAPNTVTVVPIRIQ